MGDRESGVAVAVAMEVIVAGSVSEVGVAAASLSPFGRRAVAGMTCVHVVRCRAARVARGRDSDIDRARTRRH